MNDGDKGVLRLFRSAFSASLVCGLAGVFLLGCADDPLPLVVAPATEPPVTEPPVADSPSTDPATTAPTGTDTPRPVPPAAPNTPADAADQNGVDPSSQNPTPTAAGGVSAGQQSYPTLEDGSPVPLVAIFDGDTIALSGTAPGQEASDRLETLAIANSAVPNAAVVNFMTINPDVPIGVGVRVIEMQSVRFGESKAEIVPEHAAQLDRAVSVMTALPNISVVVIGHADQRGDPAKNYEISAERAQSVVDYMAARGIEPSRLAARAVGAGDLLTLNNDDVAFELNRRTEFIFYGLLVE